MANMHDCLDSALAAGEIEGQRVEEAQNLFEQLVRRYSSEMPLHQAEASAAADLKEASRKAARSRHHAVLNQLQAMRRLKVQIENASDPGIALRNLVERSDGSGFTGESVRSVKDALTGMVNSRLREMLREHSRNLVGNVRNRAQFMNIVRQLHGEETGDATAAAMARSVETVREDLRRMFNSYGGDIGKLADHGLPHTHDAGRMRRQGRDAWIEEIAPRLDWARIEDFTTGKPFSVDGRAPSPERQRAFLEEMYENITTEGWSRRDPSMATGGKALYNRRAEHRVLHFRTADDWLAYNQAFGLSDPFSAMIGQLHGMARDVALMRVLGPNPRLGMEFAAQVAEKRVAGGDGKAMTRVRKRAVLARTMLAHLDGRANAPESEAWASFFGGVRQALTSIQLGSATVSAVTDLATIRTAAAHSGMNPNAVMARQAQLLASNATRETAAQMGYIADTLADAGSTAARFLGDTMGPEITERMASFTLRASGLSYWTDMNRVAFKMEFAGFLASNAGKSFDQVDAPLRKLFQDRGITSADWDALREAGAMFEAPGGAKFLSPFHWLEAQTTMPRAEAEGLAIRLQMAIEEQLEFAVPTASLEGRARINGMTAPGSFGGELLRSGLMYKSFALSLTINQYRRFMAIPTGVGRAAYAAKLSAGLIILGATAVQLKEMSKGRDPRPMDDSKFWLAALFQGGGLGIFGDFFTSQESRVGGGFAQTLAGPVVGLADSVADVTIGPALRAAKGENVNLGREVSNFARYNTPIFSSLWYQRLAFDRMVADQLQLFLDAEAETAWRRQERRREKEFRNVLWWERGETAPWRAPDLSNATGAQR
ncbi:MAG: hypothetical protein AAFX07_00530 [Pseudomonadota bacterium]